MSYQDSLSGDDHFQHEVEDEISLCDFPLCSHEGDTYDHPVHHDTRDQEFFEFFTKDFAASASEFPAEDIMFCGKVFCNKIEPSYSGKSQQHPDEAKKQNNSKKRTLFRWTSKKSQDEGSCLNALRNSKKSDLSLQKATELAAPIKSDKKYYMTMLGLTKLPTAMQLRDIKTRQSRQNNPSRMLGLFKNSTDMVTVNGGGGRWLWRLLKALGVGCSTGHANAAVKATFGCL